MNYLAHAFLSDNNHHLLVGNFIADHIRGNNFEQYPQGIVNGIYMHRRIDAFTDSHPLFKASKRMFYNGFEKHSGILVDIYFDHLLAKNFHDFHRQPLPQFSENVYGVYSSHQQFLPHSSNRFLEYVVKNNIYNAYATLEGIERVLYNLSQRINHQIHLNNSVKLFTEAEQELKSNFYHFFKDALIEFAPDKNPTI